MLFPPIKGFIFVLLSIILVLSTIIFIYRLYRFKMIRTIIFWSQESKSFTVKENSLDQGIFQGKGNFPWLKRCSTVKNFFTKYLIKEIFHKKFDQGNFPQSKKFSTKKFDQGNFPQSREFSTKYSIKEIFHSEEHFTHTHAHTHKHTHTHTHTKIKQILHSRRDFSQKNLIKEIFHKKIWWRKFSKAKEIFYKVVFLKKFDQGKFPQTNIFCKQNNQKRSFNAKILNPFNTKSYAIIFLAL